MNSEFQKYFPSSEFIPILRNHETNRYWINENLIKIKVGKVNYNIANAIIEIVDEYAKTKQESFQRFIFCLLAPNVDARLFEIVSYSVLKYFYFNQQIIWGFEMTKLNIENLNLYKTGSTNANDGGIDFVMKPLGRFFQVTETLDFKKYFLDIDKIQKYPITFVIKSSESIDELLNKIRENASKTYSIQEIVDKYMNCIEEVINIPVLNNRFIAAINKGFLKNILDEIIIQSKVEFNY